MSDIESLASQVEHLNASFDRWNNLTTYLIATTALVATLYFIATFVANKKATRLKNVQAALGGAKDEQLARDLKEKDKQIADATRKAAEANEKAEEERLARLRLEKEIAQRRLTGEQKATFTK